MKINWKVRFKNKVWLTSFISFLVATVYQFLSYFDIVPAVTQEAVLQVVAALLQLLGLLGVIVDPTTQGISDSDRAMQYKEPS